MGFHAASIFVRPLTSMPCAFPLRFKLLIIQIIIVLENTHNEYIFRRKSS